MAAVFVWSPGASISTKDVYMGLRTGLEQHGMTVIAYDGELEIELASIGLMHMWRGGMLSQKPTQADIIYRSGLASLARAVRARLEHGVEWVIVVSGMYQHPDFLLMLKHAGFKVALLCTESPYDLEQELKIARFADVIFTNERTSVEAFRRVQPSSHYLPHAWHPGTHAIMGVAQETDRDAAAHDVVFVGTYFHERVAFLGAIDWTGIRLGLYGGTEEIDRRTRAGRVLAPHIAGGYVRNTRTAALYRQATIGLNFHRTSKGFGRHASHITHAESLNPRVYELAATGCYFVTDDRAEVAEVFGSALATFSTPEDCEALIRAALADPVGRRASVRACQQAVRGHSWADRARQVLTTLGLEPQARADMAS